MKSTDLFETFACKKDDKARRVLNVAPDTVAQIDAAQLEAGIELEALADIGVPVFRYQTQITIHGKLPGFDESARIGGYRAIFRNANGSIGVRYLAIDGAKKSIIARATRAKRGEWFASVRSDGLTLNASFRYDQRAEAIAFANASKPLAEMVYGSLYGMALPYGAGFVVCLYVGAIPADNLWPFIAKACGIESEAALLAIEAEQEAKAAIERAERQARWDKEAAEREAEQAKLIESLAAYRLTQEPKQPGARFRMLNRYGELVTVELSGTPKRMFYTINGGQRKQYVKGWPNTCADGRLFAA